MKIAVFSTHSYDREFLDAANQSFAHELTYYREQLHPSTAGMAAGYPAVCAFVNDSLDNAVLSTLAEGGTRLIALRSAGFNNVDLKSAAKLNLTVMRVARYSPHAVAEHAVALMLMLNRKLNRACNRVREGNFDLSGLLGFDMMGKTVGIVGTGRIGASLARIMNGFGCTVLGFDTFKNPQCIEMGVRYVDLPDLLRQSDIVSLHCPSNPATRHLINRDSISLMKPGSMLINTARGALVDSGAVVEALKQHQHLSYFGMDVYEDEGPLFYADRSSSVIQDDVFERLTTFPNVVITGHQGFFTREALTQIAEVTLGNAKDFETGNMKPENVVPLPD
ncbi:MAG: 2-hydroxyacid dehydrogenase [Rhodanobacter sp.]